MRILVCNDDGIHAPGLRVLERAARSLTRDVWVVAPEHEQSAASHSLTLHRPLRLRRASARRFAVNGTPTDCIYLALNKVLAGQRPDLVLSGVNRGGNLGEDVTYSGTIAAAMEAALFGVPAIALSQLYTEGRPVRWRTAAVWVPRVVRSLLSLPWPKDVLMHVNLPDVAPDRVEGIEATAQGRHKVADQLEERIDPRGVPYFWIGANRTEERGVSGSDLAAVSAGRISVTPLCLDLTHEPTRRRLARHFRGPAGKGVPEPEVGSTTRRLIRARGSA